MRYDEFEKIWKRKVKVFVFVNVIIFTILLLCMLFKEQGILANLRLLMVCETEDEYKEILKSIFIDSMIVFAIPICLVVLGIRFLKEEERSSLIQYKAKRILQEKEKE